MNIRLDPELLDEEYHETLEKLLPRNVVVELMVDSGEMS